MSFWEKLQTFSSNRLNYSLNLYIEGVFDPLTSEQDEVLPQLFSALVEVDERATAIRRRTELNHFSESAIKLIEKLVATRLLTLITTETPEAKSISVEIAHEALFQKWRMLRYWIAGAQEDLILLRSLSQAAYDWNATGRPDYMLWSHERLAPFYMAQHRHNFVLDDIVQDFITPEAERLLDLFIREKSQYRRLSIIDRWFEIGEMAIPFIIDAMKLLSKEDVLVEKLQKFLQRYVKNNPDL